MENERCLSCDLPECNEGNALCFFYIDRVNYRKKWLKTPNGQKYLKESNERMKEWKKKWRKTPEGKASEAESRKKLTDRGYYKEWRKKNPEKKKLANKIYYKKNRIRLLIQLKEKRQCTKRNQ